MSSSAAIRQSRAGEAFLSELGIRCFVCSGEMEALVTNDELSQNELTCAMCGSTMLRLDGVWCSIRPSRAPFLAGPLASYEAVREAEGRWSHSAEFYRSLPFKDTTGKFVDQWKIRAQSFRFVIGKVLPNCSKANGRSQLRILDIGAGNCWMSYRLSLAGHMPVAVDISLSSLDGLGAARHYRDDSVPSFPCFQAEMDWLPFAPEQFDVAIFNASFHYARNYELTLLETLRVLRPNGVVLIVDSPTYPNEADGEAMKREKSEEFSRRYGTDCGSMGGREYLTPEILKRLQRIGLSWRRYSLWRGWRWGLRPLAAQIAGRRKPSQFYIYLGTTTNEGAKTR